MAKHAVVNDFGRSSLHETRSPIIIQLFYHIFSIIFEENTRQNGLNTLVLRKKH